MVQVVKISHLFLIFTYLLANLEGTNVTLTVSLTINLIILLSYFFITKQSVIKKGTKLPIITSGIIILFSIYSIIFANDIFLEEIVENAIRMLLFILNIYFTAFFIRHNNIKFFLKSTYLVICGFLIINYLINFDNFQVFFSLDTLFNSNSYLRYRETFGLRHPNSLGSICLTALVLSAFIINIEKKKLLNKYFFSNLIICIMLLSSASRNSITSLILFLILLFLSRNINRLNIKYKKSYFNIATILCIASISTSVIVYIISKWGMFNILKESNRLLNFAINIPVLFSNNKEFFGLGLVDVQTFFPGVSIYNTTYVDNWFLYVFLTLGMVGFISCIMIIFSLLKSILNTKRYKELERNYIIILFIVHIYYSLFETAFLFPESLLSYVFWIIYFVYISNGKSKYKYLQVGIGGLFK